MLILVRKGSVLLKGTIALAARGSKWDTLFPWIVKAHMTVSSPGDYRCTTLRTSKERATLQTLPGAEVYFSLRIETLVFGSWALSFPFTLVAALISRCTGIGASFPSRKTFYRAMAWLSEELKEKSAEG